MGKKLEPWVLGAVTVMVPLAPTVMVATPSPEAKEAGQFIGVTSSSVVTSVLPFHSAL